MSIQLDKVQPKTKEQLKQLINYAFKHDIYDLNFIDTNKITDMSWLFENVKHNFDISSWDVSNVTDTEFMFYFCVNFNCDLSGWDVSNVTNMKYMFACCEKFNCDLSNWDVSNVTGMYFMFGHCKQFNCDLSHWNVSKVKDMKDMFTCCDRLTIPDWYKK